MNKYELVYIVDAHAPQATKDEIAKQVADAIVKSETKATNTQVWLERSKLNFLIGKVAEGTYYLINIEAKTASITKLQTLLRINEQILRFLVIRQEAKKVVATAAVAAV